ncbi:hypothetical protein F4780DRAFT_549988 [Xylariomycetidae sp. FL0641]|nr:hypothetical protein F4780DRAFT_549988 [Xylariomycetidae sp. FL0641]
MQLSEIISSLIVAAACVSALPKPTTEKRATGGILLCNGVNATGDCHYEVYALDACHNVPDGFSKKTSTFAPDGDGFYCTPYVGTCEMTCSSPTGCTFGGTIDFYNPAKFNLAEIAWDESLMSFECTLNSTSTAKA